MVLTENKLVGLNKNSNMLKAVTKTSNNLYNYRSIFPNVSPYVTSDFGFKNFHLSPVASQQCSAPTKECPPPAEDCPPPKPPKIPELPNLPIPSLMKTFYKYMRTIKPIITDEEYAKHCEIMNKFVAPNGEGRKLQELLKVKAKNMENWLAEWWLYTAYLSYRNPVCVYSSPGQLMPFQDFKDKCDQIQYSAKLVLGAYNYMAQIKDNRIKQDMMGKNPLDMSQYTKIFGTCRIPGTKVDKLQYNEYPTYIIVIHNNHFFRLDLCVNGEMINYDQLCELLESIVSNSQCLADPIGALSADNRDNWGSIYEKLMKDGCNKHAIKTIQSSAFTLCLDKKYGGKDKLTMASSQLIHGGGAGANGGNRWYDKTVNFIVSEDGAVGMLYEHSPAEGQPVAVMADFIVNSIGCFNPSCLKPACGIKCPEKLTFNITKDALESLKTAVVNLDALADNLQLNCVQFKKYGKEFIKCQQFSPDSYIQMALQLAFYRVHKIPGVCYESASTRMYIFGRTETIRSCSIESVHFVKTFLDICSSDEDKIAALCAAIQSHKKYTIEALHGYGVDRHLLGLRLIAKEKKLPEPVLFSDASYKKGVHFRLSTSQVATNSYGLMSYGPAVENGYSICYNPRADDIFFSIGAFASCKETDVGVLGKALQQSLIDMHDVLVKYAKSKL